MTIQNKYVAKKGRPPIAKVAVDILSPEVKVLKSAIVSGMTFNNQPIPRYYLSVSCDPKICDGFLTYLDNIRQKEECEVFLTEETIPQKEGGYTPTGNYVIKFSTKDKPVVYGEGGEIVELEDDLITGTKIAVEFDISCYFDKASKNYKLTFPCKKIYLIKTDEKKRKK